MPPGERVLFLQEEGARELQAHAHQFRPLDQNGAEGSDGLVELLIPGVVPQPACLDNGLHARPKQGPDAALGSRLLFGSLGARHTGKRWGCNDREAGKQYRCRDQRAETHESVSLRQCK